MSCEGFFSIYFSTKILWYFVFINPGHDQNNLFKITKPKLLTLKLCVSLYKRNDDIITTTEIK